MYSFAYIPFWLAGLKTASGPFRWLTDSCLAMEKLLAGRKVRAMARRLHKKYEFSLVHGHETYLGDEAASIGQMLGIPSVFTLHGLYSHHLQTFGEWAVQRAVANINAIDRLVAPSRVSAESYQRHGVHRQFSIVPNGVNLVSPEAIPSNVSHDVAAFIQGKSVLLTVGFFVREKRIDQAIRALGRLHRRGMTNVVLIVVGRGRLEKELRETIKGERLDDAVRIVGEVRPESMSTFYLIADVLVHPSVAESYSMVCLEAMSFGKAVVCTSGIGLAEYLRSGVDALVIAPDDEDALSQAILGLLKNPSQRRRLGREARRTAARLSWTRQVAKIERIYEELLSKPQ